MFYHQSHCSIYHADCRELLPTLEQKVTAVVCDPPYGLSFDNHAWDVQIPDSDYWRIILEACLPGAPLLAFGGTRTHHRLMCAIEDAGWEIRDCMMWLHADGFPKGCDISKQLSLHKPISYEQILRATAWMREAAKQLGVSHEDMGLATGKRYMYKHWLTHKSQAALPQLEDWEKLEPLLGVPPSWFKALLHLKKHGKTFSDREMIGEIKTNRTAFFKAGEKFSYPLTIPTNPHAKRWQGYHTRLKPAWEPIILAQKPMPSTYAENARTYGVAGLNMAATRFDERWPTNVLHDGSPDILTSLGQAARFFHSSKVKAKDRGEGNTHPTVKPQSLMEYLLKLVTMPEKNLILDPFMGSGSTLMACKTLGLPCIGIELEASYCQMAARRLSRHVNPHSN